MLNAHAVTAIWQVASGGVGALILSAVSRALPDPLPMGNRFYLFFYRFIHILLANLDKTDNVKNL
jgi:hypothetical protein